MLRTRSGFVRPAPIALPGGVQFGIGGFGRSSDSIYFVSQLVDGDFTLTARLSDVAWARDGRGQKVGLMIRGSTEPNAETFLMKLGNIGARQAAAAARSTAGGAIDWTGGNDYTWLPAWFRLKRIGDTFVALESPDGRQWFEVVRREITGLTDSPGQAGLFVTSGGTTPTVVHFDHVSIER